MGHILHILVLLMAEFTKLRSLSYLSAHKTWGPRPMKPQTWKHHQRDQHVTSAGPLFLLVKSHMLFESNFGDGHQILYISIYIYILILGTYNYINDIWLYIDIYIYYKCLISWDPFILAKQRILLTRRTWPAPPAPVTSEVVTQRGVSWRGCHLETQRWWCWS